MSTRATTASAGIEIALDPDHSARDAYVLGHPCGTPFHLSAWSRAVTRAFGHENLDLVARRDGDVVGFLPLGLSSSLLFGRRLVSAPFAVYGGPLADDREIEDRLVTEAALIAEGRLVKSLEVRCRDGGPATWPAKLSQVTFRGRMGGLGSLPKETRRAVRVGLEEGFVPEVGWHAFGDFWRLFARAYRDHGTPVFPARWLVALREEFGGDCILFSLRDGAGGDMAAGVMCLLFRDEVLPYYVGADRARYPRKLNHVLYYELMEWARSGGLEVFDFGRSRKGTGSYAFKREWGLEEIPLEHRFHLVTDLDVPDLTPSNPKFQCRIALWRKLPVALANLLGPRIVRGQP